MEMPPAAQCVPPSGTQLPACEGGWPAEIAVGASNLQIALHTDTSLQTVVPTISVLVPTESTIPSLIYWTALRGETWSVAGASEVLLGQCNAFLKKTSTLPQMVFCCLCSNVVWSVVTLSWQMQLCCYAMWFCSGFLLRPTLLCYALLLLFPTFFSLAFYFLLTCMLIFPHLRTAFCSLLCISFLTCVLHFPQLQCTFSSIACCFFLFLA